MTETTLRTTPPTTARRWIPLLLVGARLLEVSLLAPLLVLPIPPFSTLRQWMTATIHDSCMGTPHHTPGMNGLCDWGSAAYTYPIFALGLAAAVFLISAAISWLGMRLCNDDAELYARYRQSRRLHFRIAVACAIFTVAVWFFINTTWFMPG